MKARLWNPFTQRRERTIELDGLPNPEGLSAVPAHEIAGDPFAMLRELGFDPAESRFLICYVVEEYPLRELPERLWCSPAEVERLRARVNRKRVKLRYEAAMSASAYENIRFGTG